MKVEYDEKRKLIDFNLEREDDGHVAFTIDELLDIVLTARKRFGLP